MRRFAFLLYGAAKAGFRGYSSSTSRWASDFGHGLNRLPAEKVLACTGNMNCKMCIGIEAPVLLNLTDT